MLLHDIGDNHNKNSDDIFKQIQSVYPYHARMMKINSLTQENSNQQQPDWWSRWLLPKFFLSPTSSDLESPMLLNPETGRAVLGSRLSIEDFMQLQTFCTDLFMKDIVPAIERRLTLLNRLI